MDQVIFEEFKGTGNSELVLSRELAERRIFPAIDLVASATRREELLLGPEALAASRTLRQRFAGMSAINAMNDLLTDLKRTKSERRAGGSADGGDVTVIPSAARDLLRGYRTPFEKIPRCARDEVDRPPPRKPIPPHPRRASLATHPSRSAR